MRAFGGLPARLLSPDRPSVYHVVSRTTLPGLPLSDADKDHLVHLLQKFAGMFFEDVLGYCMMGNHIHLALRVHPESGVVDDNEVRERFHAERGETAHLSEIDLEAYRKRLCSLSEFMRMFKQSFGRYYNKKHRKKGYFWGDRYKSTIVQEGETLVNLLAYIDLNPVRAGIVTKPEDYRWSGLGYLVQTSNRHKLLDLDLGMKEWNELDPKEIIRKYRQFVYETGAVGRSQESGERKKRNRHEDRRAGTQEGLPLEPGGRFPPPLPVLHGQRHYRLKRVRGRGALPSPYFSKNTSKKCYNRPLPFSQPLA
ncbi:transposase [Desulfonatronum lacustre]|uniref:transposase n=1 Tax=Desulfonatronum lacustre TaxID=66849 RepID=UPI00048D22B6|nr:transposase [Desulfonatronum lacustre]